MCSSSGLGSMAIVGFFFCLLQLLSPCMPFSLGARGDTLKGGIINWCMFVWCFCQSRLPFSWDGFLCAYAFHSAFICLSASIIFSTTYV
ncbi:hypothetical protein CB1_001662008 [Camelus ferus]|nr:hypothetical protein CB1_001662008 [Camelus ferus]